MGTFTKFSPGSGRGNYSIDEAITGTGTAISFHDCRQVSWSTIYTAGNEPTQGTIVIEQAPSADYAGVWNTLATITLTDVVLGTDGYGTYPGQTGFVRARFTADSDEDVSVILNGLLN